MKTCWRSSRHEEGWLSGQKRQTVNLLPTGYVWFESHTFHNMKGETIFDIVDTGKDSRIKITDERGTRARLIVSDCEPLVKV